MGGFGGAEVGGPLVCSLECSLCLGVGACEILPTFPSRISDFRGCFEYKWNAALGWPAVLISSTRWVCGLLGSPADERGDDDAPGRAAAVGPGGLPGLGAPAAQPEGVEEQEEEVQGQADQGDAAQQRNGLWRRGAGHRQEVRRDIDRK